MAREWLNLVGSLSGSAPITGYEDIQSEVELGGQNVRLWETNRSGSVLINSEAWVSYGDPEVYLRINFTEEPFRYLSAPLLTHVDVFNVRSLELHVLLPLAPADARYRAFVNAHCVYEII